MERAGDLQPNGSDRAFGSECLEPFDRRDRPTRHHLLGGVLVRHHQDTVPADLVAELLGIGGADAEQRRHATRLVLARALHRDPTDDDELERVAQRHRPPCDHSCEFPE